MRDDLRLLLALTDVALVGMLGPYFGWGVRAGCRVDVLGWACLDDACTLLWASFGLAVLEDTRCLSIASCLVEGFGRNVGFSPNVGWGVRAGSRVDVLGRACLDDACTLLWALFGLACS
ncbi:hypothetical protein Csa_021690 [Cucumis sativus]|uniref:Uncharacterized protein n=1 Tax=Cucumis sativus TaxID=3659 RepID=A0ACB6HB60_CUCSA|nr:hypothetical protein CSA_015441 [Cucumis sativus]KAE8652005.1 hypothetical protein Csa_021690 [Cucumis sativus]